MLEVAAAAAPGPANGHGGSTRSGDGLEHLDGVGPQEPVAVLALGDLDGDQLARQRVPDEHDDALVPGDDEAAVRDPAPTSYAPDQRAAARAGSRGPVDHARCGPGPVAAHLAAADVAGAHRSTARSARCLATTDERSW